MSEQSEGDAGWKPVTGCTSSLSLDKCHITTGVIMPDGSVKTASEIEREKFDEEAAREWAMQTYESHEEQWAFMDGVKWQARAAQQADALALETIRTKLLSPVRKAIEKVPVHFSGFPKDAAVVVDTWAMVFASMVVDEIANHLSSTPPQATRG